MANNGAERVVKVRTVHNIDVNGLAQYFTEEAGFRMIRDGDIISITYLKSGKFACVNTSTCIYWVPFTGEKKSEDKK